MNKQARITLHLFALISIVTLFIVMSLVLANHVVTDSETGTTTFNSADEDTLRLFNITVNNSDVGQWANVTQVNITIPSTFAYNDTQGDDTGGFATFTNTSTVLSWENTTNYLINGSIVNTFFFYATPDTPGDFNITVGVTNSSSTTTQNISITVNDTTVPDTLDYDTETTLDALNLSQSNFDVNVTATDNGVIDTIAIYLYNTTDLLNTTTSSTSPNYINFINLADGVYTFNASVNDTAGNLNQSIASRTVRLDSTAPEFIEYGTGTETDGANLSQSNIVVNVTATDSSMISAITIYLFNSTGDQINATSTATSPNYIDFVSLADGAYTFNATVNDTAGGQNQTASRSVNLDTGPPTIDYAGDTPGDGETLAQNNIPVNVSTSADGDIVVFRLYDNANTLLNTTMDTSSPFFIDFVSLADGIYIFNSTVNDTTGNINTTASRTVTMGIPSLAFDSSTTGNGTQPDRSILVNMTSSDTSEHYVFNDYDESLVLWMRMDDISGTTVTDLSIYSYDGELVNDASFNSTGYWGNASWYDGDGDYITIGDDLNVSATFSVSAWIYAQTDGVLQTIAEKYYGAAANDTFELARDASNQITFTGYTSSANSTINSQPVANNSWIHVVGIYDGTNIALYINSTQANTTTLSGSLNGNDNNITLGARDSSGTLTQNFTGAIDEVLIFNRSLDATEIGALYNATATQYVRTFTGIVEGNYTFTGHAVDQDGDRNDTESRNVTINFPLDIDIEEPDDGDRYDTNDDFPIEFLVDVDAQASHIFFTIDGGDTNYTMDNETSTRYNYTFSSISRGNYTFQVYSNDTDNMRNDTENTTFEVYTSEGGGGGSCFLAGTLIEMADGTNKKIEDVKVGDNVLGFDENRRESVSVEVLELENPIREGYYNLKLRDGTTLRVTNEHPLYMRKSTSLTSSGYEGWASINPLATKNDAGMIVKRIEAGDKLLTRDGWTEVVSLEYIKGDVQTYNLKNVAHTNTFFADGVLAHNKNHDTDGGWDVTYDDDDQDLEDRGSIDRALEVDERSRLRINGETHHVGVVGLTAVSVTVNVSSDPQQVTLNLGESQLFDVSDPTDEIYDIEVLLNDVADNAADLTFIYSDENYTDDEPDQNDTDPVCGDGVFEGDEACDDGDTDPDDGCSDTCTIESGWTCDTGSDPTSCSQVVEDDQTFWEDVKDNFKDAGDRIVDNWIFWTIIVVLILGVGVWYFFARRKFMEQLKGKKTGNNVQVTVNK